MFETATAYTVLTQPSSVAALQSLEDEQAYLAAALLNPEVLDKHPVPTAAFAAPQHRLIYRAMRVVYGRTGALDIGAVASLLRRYNRLEKAGGVEYLADLLTQADRSLTAGQHAAVLVDLHHRRVAVEALREALQRVYDPRQPVAGVHDLVAERVGKALALSQTGDGGVSLAEAFRQVIETARERAEVRAQGTDVLWPWPWPSVRKVVIPRPAEFGIVAGRPGMGKTAALAAVAMAAAARGKRVLYATLEMSAAQVAERIAVWTTGIPAQKLRRGEATAQDLAALEAAQQRLVALPLEFYYQPSMTPTMLQQAISRFAARHGGVDLVVVDYLGLMSPGRGYDGENMTTRTTIISKRMMEIASWVGEKWGGWLLAAHQLNRALLSRAVKRPTLADLRDSGALEQDAASVFFLYHPDGEDPPEEPGALPMPKPRRLYMAKDRFGRAAGREWAMQISPFTGELVEVASSVVTGVAEDVPV